jgi:hypothetical protein
MDHSNTAEKKLLQDIKDKNKEKEDTEGLEDASEEGAFGKNRKQLGEQQQQQTHNEIF